jgi:hypothetical protein
MAVTVQRLAFVSVLVAIPTTGWSGQSGQRVDSQRGSRQGRFTPLSIIKEGADVMAEFKDIASKLKENDDASAHVAAEQIKKASQRLSDIRSKMRKQVPVLQRAYIPPDEKAPLAKSLDKDQRKQFASEIARIVAAEERNRGLLQRYRGSQKAADELGSCLQSYHVAEYSFVVDSRKMAELLAVATIRMSPSDKRLSTKTILGFFDAADTDSTVHSRCLSAFSGERLSGTRRPSEHDRGMIHFCLVLGMVPGQDPLRHRTFVI